MAHEREGIPERVALSDAEKVARWNILMRDDLLAITLTTTKHRRCMLTPELIEDVHTSFLAGMIDSMLNAGGTLPADPTPEAARGCATKVNAHWEAGR